MSQVVHTPSRTSGFTIVELLIVIVVIGILAAITLVAFGGVRDRANNSAVQSDLRNFHSIMAQHKAINGRYPSNLTADMGIRLSRDAHDAVSQSRYARYCYNSSTDNYIFYARAKSGAYFSVSGATGAVGSADVVVGGFDICSKIGLVGANPVTSAYNSQTDIWEPWVN